MDLSRTEETACPLCNGDRPQEKYNINSWKIVQCTICRFVYVNPRLRKAALYRLYTDNYFDNTVVGYYHYTENKELRKQNFRKWVADALPHLAHRAVHTALDVGCAAGYCLEVFAEKGWISNGIELDKNLAASVREKGFAVFDTPLLTLKSPGTYSIITVFDVLEHLTDLHDNMRKLYSLLDDGGILVLVTPDYGSWQRRLFGKKWFQFKPVEHINYFSKASLQRLAGDTGFSMIACKRSGQYCDSSFLQNRLRKYDLSFLLPPFRFVQRQLGLKNKRIYIDTASVHVILRKGAPGKEGAQVQSPTG